mmetsp:Transcript_99032/g.302779  ORF Transcript_99032/g.302779 Transcript_99032/m.302779 type:complete len:382 (+) Transcript_99032:906-2051(+)
MLALVERGVVCAKVAVRPEPPAWQAEAALDVVHLERLAVHLDLSDQLPSALHRQHAIRDAARQRQREERLRPHRERRQEPLVALGRPHAFDDVEQLPALGGLVQDGRTSEASEYKIFRSEEEIPQTLELLGILRLRPHQVVGLVHEHDFVAVDVRTALVEADFHQARHRPSLLVQHAEGSTSRGVADGPQWRNGHALPWILLEERDAILPADLPLEEHSFHLQDLPDGVAKASDLLLGEAAQVPHVDTALSPIRPSARDGSVRGPLAAEVIAVPARPSQQLRIKVAADRVLREDGHLGPGVEEVVLEHADHLAGLAGTRRVVDEHPGDRALGVEEEGHGLLVRLQGRTCRVGVEFDLQLRLPDLGLLHHCCCPQVELLEAR